MVGCTVCTVVPIPAVLSSSLCSASRRPACAWQSSTCRPSPKLPKRWVALPPLLLSPPSRPDLPCHKLYLIAPDLIANAWTAVCSVRSGVELAAWHQDPTQHCPWLLVPRRAPHCCSQAMPPTPQLWWHKQWQCSTAFRRQLLFLLQERRVPARKRQRRKAREERRKLFQC